MGPVKKRKRGPKNRETKVHLIFDEKARKEYLTGFRKRKNERRQKAKEKMERHLKEEKRRIKQEARDFRKAHVQNFTPVPEVDHLVEQKTYNLPQHTVIVTEIDNSEIMNNRGFLGVNRDESDAEVNTDNKETVHGKGKVKARLKITKHGKMQLKKAGKPKHKNMTHLQDKHKLKKERDKRRKAEKIIRGKHQRKRTNPG
ncbi:nucleolar protein 12 [Lingula anatina]|uniref:Nucleolar protein 12 n=1 Tax=Lingula anatina TaxID=7574 RepID=A0A1S3ILJ8_LINAN|nr:nucleolar protein 12 [Lingula anatina]|eukprot:XP_013398394.1 nucleolar protein 12 [Lingula anatina]